MKVSEARIDLRKKELVIKAGRRTYRYPFGLVSADDPVTAVEADAETGNEAITCCLASGATRTIHLDDIRAHLGDAAFLREQLLYQMTLKAQQQIREKRLAKRAICRMLGTSPAQVYRLLDQTCYTKTVDQMLRLLQALGCTVTLQIGQAA